MPHAEEPGQSENLAFVRLKADAIRDAADKILDQSADGAVLSSATDREREFA